MTASLQPRAWCLALAVACSPAGDSGQDAPTGAVTKGDDLDQTSGGSSGGDALGCPDAATVFPPQWPQGGPACGTEQEITVHRYDDDTFILRQSLCTSVEGPFIFLLFGEDKVLVEDSGAGGVAMFDAVRGVVDMWLAEHGKDAIEIVLINSHAHGDHVAGNDMFEGQPGVTVIGFGVEAVSTFFAIDWPSESAVLDLGGRVIDVVPIPGHEASHVALYDRNARLLLTGDTLYPGRLFIDDFTQYKPSIDKLVTFATQNPVCWVLGTHIEMSTTPGDDYEFDAEHHPNEHVLQMTTEHLRELQAALAAMGTTAKREVHDDFIVFPL